MSRSQQARFSFSAGVLSPRMTLRADSDRQSSACRLMQNFIVTPQGGALLRHGSEYIGVPSNPTLPFRVFSFRDGGDRSDTLFEVGPGKTRQWRDDVLLDNPTPLLQEIDNPYTEEDLKTVNFTNQESVVVMLSNNHPPQYMQLEAEKTITILPFPAAEVPQMVFADYKSPRLQGGTAVYTVDFTEGGWVNNDPFFFTYNGITNRTYYYNTRFQRRSRLNTEYEPYSNENFNEQTIYRYSTTAATMIATLEACFNEARALRTGHTISAVNVSPGVYEVTVDGPFSGKPAQIRHTSILTRVATCTITGGKANTGAEPAWSYPYTVLHNGQYYVCILPHTSATENEPGVGVDWQIYWELQPAAPPWMDWQHPDNNPWAIGQIYAPWDRGFPGVGEFHQQRLILAGSQDAPTTIWGSRIGVYRDFETGPEDTDPVQFSVETSDTPAIKWMSSTALGLLIGTSAGEFIISAQITISPGDIQVQRQNYSRSSRVQPVKVGNVVFYPELGKTKLRASQYNRDLLGYESIDASITAEHLLYSGLERMEMLRTPESVMTMVRGDGWLNFMTYDTAQGINAYAEANFGDIVYDITSIYSTVDDEDEIYMCVQRGESYLLEKMRYPRRFFGADLEGVVHLDSFETGDLVAEQTITGLDRLEGRDVRVTLDDADIGIYRVETDGSVDLGVARTGRYAVGLPYVGRIVTYEHVSGNPAGVGFGTARKWNKLYVRLLDSGLPKINGQLPADRTPATPMDLPEPLRSEDARIHNLGFGDGSIEIVQDLPFPTHILGVYGEFASHNA
jgi:hypothetical protein